MNKAERAKVVERLNIEDDGSLSDDDLMNELLNLSIATESVESALASEPIEEDQEVLKLRAWDILQTMGISCRYGVEQDPDPSRPNLKLYATLRRSIEFKDIVSVKDYGNYYNCVIDNGVGKVQAVKV